MDDIGHVFPIYGQVEEIIIWEDEKFFIATKLETLSFHKQYMAYEIEREDTRVIISWSNLPWYGVLNVILKMARSSLWKKTLHALKIHCCGLEVIIVCNVKIKIEFN